MSDNMDKTEMNQDATQQSCSEQNAEESLDQAAAALKAAIDAGDFDIKEFLSQYKMALDAKEEINDKLLRLQADFDNFRRRSRKEEEEAGLRSQSELVAMILPVIDNFDRALAAMADSADKEGVAMISKQLQEVLACAGLCEIQALGCDFDPNFHHAVAQLPGDEAQKGKVTAVLQKGYLFNERLVRASVVQVGV
jgi:molecular chaperone GrpE